MRFKTKFLKLSNEANVKLMTKIFNNIHNLQNNHRSGSSLIIVKDARFIELSVW